MRRGGSPKCRIMKIEEYLKPNKMKPQRRGASERKSEMATRRRGLVPRNFLNALRKNPMWRRTVSVSYRRFPGSRPELHKEKSLKCCKTPGRMLIFWPLRTR